MTKKKATAFLFENISNKVIILEFRIFQKSKIDPLTIVRNSPTQILRMGSTNRTNFYDKQTDAGVTPDVL